MQDSSTELQASMLICKINIFETIWIVDIVLDFCYIT